MVHTIRSDRPCQRKQHLPYNMGLESPKRAFRLKVAKLPVFADPIVLTLFLASDAALFEFGEGKRALHVWACKWRCDRSSKTYPDAFFEHIGEHFNGYADKSRRQTHFVAKDKIQVDYVQSRRTTNRVETILEAVDNQPKRSTRSITRKQGVHHATVWRVLRKERLHSYHLLLVQSL